MKVYVTGDSDKYTIALSNVLNSTNNSAIMSEVKSNDYEDLVMDVAQNINNDFDVATMVSSNPIEANIEANKTGKLRAAVVRSVAEAKYARKAGVNLIILDAATFNKSDALNIIKSWLNTSDDSRQDTSQQKMPKQKITIKESGNNVLSSFMPKDAMVKKQKRKPEPQMQDDVDVPAPKEGIIKRIKYTFGIID